MSPPKARQRRKMVVPQKADTAASAARRVGGADSQPLGVPHWAALAILTVAVVASYGGTLWNGFVHDDQTEIVENRFVHDLGHTWQIITTPSWGFKRQESERPGVNGYRAESNYYRPLQYLTYAFLYRLFGPAPAAFHAYKLLLHLCACLVLWTMVRRWCADLALPAAGIFAVHPALSEAVAWISAVTDVSCGLCFLLALAAYMHWQRRPSSGRLVVLYGVFLLGVFSKETMLVFLPVLVVYQRVWEGHWPRAADWKLVYVPLALVASLYLAMRLVVLGSLVVPGRERFAYLTGTRAAINQLVLLSDYLSKFLRPEPLNAFHVFRPVLSLADRRVGFASGIACAVAVAVVLLARRLGTRERRLMLFSMVWVLAALAPALVFFRRIGENVFAERYLYLPFAGLSIAAAAACSGILRRWPRAGLTLLALMMALGVWRVRERVPVFRNPVAFYEDTLRQSPEASLWRGLADAYREAGRFDDALPAYRRMLALDPNNFQTLCNLGAAYNMAGRLDEAIAAYRSSLAIQPNEMAYSNLGIAYSQQGRFDEALRAYRDAIAIRPTARSYYNLGTTYEHSLHRLPEAIAAYEAALRLDPDDRETRLTLERLRAETYKEAGRLDDAALAYQRILALNPRDYETLCNLGVAYNMAGRLDEAIAAYRASLAVKPNEMAYSNLGIAYHQQGHFDEALRAHRDALALGTTARNYYNLGTTYHLGLHRLPEAIAAYEAALRLEPDNREAKRALERARAEQAAAAGASPAAQRAP